MSSVELSNYSYTRTSVDKQYLHDVNGALFHFDKKLKNIGVNLSGGADSALGTSILCELITKHKTETKITVITNIRCWKTRPWQEPVALEVYNKIREMFPNVYMERVLNYIAPELEDGAIGKIKQLGKTGDRVITSSFNQYISYTRKLEKIYAFITHNPVDENFVCDSSGPADRYWTKDKIDQCKTAVQLNTATNLIRPWILLQKDFIIDTYIKKDWLELFNTTRSCEGDSLYFDMPDYTNYEHNVTPLKTCNYCFWCKERQWAWEKVHNEF